MKLSWAARRMVDSGMLLLPEPERAGWNTAFGDERGAACVTALDVPDALLPDVERTLVALRAHIDALVRSGTMGFEEDAKATDDIGRLDAILARMQP